MPRIVDDILAPKDTIIVRFDGKNPFLPATMVTNVLRTIMKITSKDVLETDVRWDTVQAEMRDFYGRWMGKKTEDAWSKTLIRIVMQGSLNFKERTGWVRIELKGTLNTEYNTKNFIQNAFWWVYNRTFYNHQRRLYIEEGKDMLYDMRDVFQKALGIAPEK